MLKSLAIGLLTAAALCSTAAFADNDNGSGQGDDSNQWNQLYQWCERNTQCDEWEDKWIDQDDHDHHPAAAPEIDPAGAMAALSLLAGGLAVVRGRRSRRKQTV